jgi:Skp family chaperone for outer membrane proteins
MTMIKIQQMGWVVAAGIAGMMAGSGFQSKVDKFGVVDLAEVFSSSEFAKNQTDALRNLSTQRQDVLQFVNTYPVMKAEQATRFRELSVKPQITAAEKAELDKLKAEIIAQDKKFKDLQLKPQPTPAEVDQLREYNNQTQNMVKTIERWAREFGEEVNTLQEKLRKDTLERVKTAVQEVGQKQGYTVVYVQDIVPYAANNITAESLKAMNSKK